MYCQSYSPRLICLGPRATARFSRSKPSILGSFTFPFWEEQCVFDPVSLRQSQVSCDLRYPAELKASSYINRNLVPRGASINEPLGTTTMPSDSRPRSCRPSKPPSSPTPYRYLDPAQAIAEAWKRETPESQRQWRLADLRAKQQYLSPPLWTTTKTPVGVKL
ncbi:hypothetical protein C8Q72DRAFT_38567 [Fomitopsis betulina]|nr:hypothetical protein C8Q72DRAFT_38567 [Fomitopsis betulina]